MFINVSCFIAIIHVFITSSSAHPLIDSNESNAEKIVGGTAISRTKFPFFVSVTGDRWSFPHHFSGALLNDRWILTIASNMPFQFDVENAFITLEVIVGTGFKGINGSTYTVEHIAIHPAFDKETKANNIALLKTRDPIRMNDRVRPIGLSAEYIAENYVGYVVGYRNVSLQLVVSGFCVVFHCISAEKATQNGVGVQEEKHKKGVHAFVQS